jgi:hypothetical protein
MAVFRFMGIPEAIASEARRTLRSPQYGHPAHREAATGYGPCRLCLRTFVLGEEERLLFTYQPFQDPGSLPAPGPIFVHMEPCERYDAPELPPDLQALPLVFEGYGVGGRLLVQERVGTQLPEEVLSRVFEVDGVAYAHLRNGEAGCFMARVERGFARDWAAPSDGGARPKE